jgi:hypothetical protein
MTEDYESIDLEKHEEFIMELNTFLHKCDEDDFQFNLDIAVMQELEEVKKQNDR